MVVGPERDVMQRPPEEMLQPTNHRRRPSAVLQHLKQNKQNQKKAISIFQRNPFHSLGPTKMEEPLVIEYNIRVGHRFIRLYL